VTHNFYAIKRILVGNEIIIKAKSRLGSIKIIIITGIKSYFTSWFNDFLCYKRTIKDKKVLSWIQ